MIPPIEISKTKAQPLLTETPTSKEGLVQVERATPNKPPIEIPETKAKPLLTDTPSSKEELVQVERGTPEQADQWKFQRRKTNPFSPELLG